MIRTKSLHLSNSPSSFQMSIKSAQCLHSLWSIPENCADTELTKSNMCAWVKHGQNCNYFWTISSDSCRASRSSLLTSAMCKPCEHGWTPDCGPPETALLPSRPVEPYLTTWDDTTRHAGTERQESWTEDLFQPKLRWLINVVLVTFIMFGNVESL